MNKLTKSSKVGLITGLVLISSTLLYLVFFKNSGATENVQAPPSQNSSTVSMDKVTEINLGESLKEVAPVYSDIEGSNATIQISEETKQNSQSGALPQGFGLEAASNGQNPTQASTETPLQQLPIDLETPISGAQTSPQPPSDTTETALNKDNIETMDPREVGVTANDGPDKDYEETVLTVQRTLTAVNPDGEKQLIRLKIPVMYKSRTLRLEGTTRVKAQEILEKLKTKGEELTKIKTELEATLVEWNQLVTIATPYEVLLPESPTLPQNQSAGRINREDNPSMSAGKAISYEIINK